ncbi:MAG: hypothetical protein ABSG40_23290 [Terriglobales bacterium]|jgi:hypothetical protein
MAENAATPQQPVISIRISEALRLRLETLKKIMFLKSGQTVSTSEAAKQLLESARDDRLELVDLLTEPTDSLLRIRGKADSGLSLSQAEWTMVAHYCAVGAESFMNTAQGQISYEILAEILEAFLAAYAIARRPKKSPLDFVYLMTLPGDKQVEAKAEDIGSDDVHRVVTRTIQMLRNSAQKRRKPILAVRNLYRLLDEEKFSNIEKLNEVLWPHWPALWRVCARGHYSLHRKPLREKVPAETNDEDFELAVQSALPSLEEGGYRLDLVREEGNEFSPRLQFPGMLAPQYPVCGYPRIAEFRRMLEELDLERDLRQWQGYYFYAHTAILENEERGVFFFARENGITFRFPMAHWQSIRNLFRRAWQAPEVIHTWGAQVLEYGEL